MEAFQILIVMIIFIFEINNKSSMNTKEEDFIIAYTNDIFLNVINKFQTFTASNLQYLHKLLKDDSQSQQQPKKKTVKAERYRLAVIRILYNQNYIFILTKKLDVYRLSKPIPQLYCCLIVEPSYENYEASLQRFKYLIEVLTVSNYIAVIDPQLQNEPDLNLVICRTSPQKIKIEQINKEWKQKINIIKGIGNQIFASGKYLRAFFFYEKALSCCSDLNQSKSRAILYANGSACFYKLNLFDACLMYSNIAIRIDNTYVKSYIRKINALLEKKIFGEIPGLLNCLQRYNNNQYFQEMNKKFSTYLSNSLGMYNWKQILSNPDNTKVSHYLSKKLGIRKQGESLVYYALDHIKSYQFLILTKPILYIKAGDNIDETFFQIFKCGLLSKSYAQVIKTFRYLQQQVSGNGSTSSSLQIDNKLNKRIKENLLSVKPLIYMRPQDKDYLGVWPQFYKISHSCSPNSTWIHIRSLLVVSAIQQIKKGETVTIDILPFTALSATRQILKNQYGVICNCKYCEPRKIMNIEVPLIKQQFEEMKSEEDIVIRKSLSWKMITEHLKKKEYPSDQLVYSYIQLVNISLTWDDVINLISLMRGQIKYKSLKVQHKEWNIQSSKNSIIPESMFVKALSTFLKVSKKQAIELIRILIER